MKGLSSNKIPPRSLDQGFSIVTPNLNMASYLRETIESVIQNLRPGDQYFVIDGGSVDGSQEVIRSYQNYITHWVSEPDHGHADALTKGFALSTMPFQCWVNSGDVLLSGALDCAAHFLDSSGTDCVYGDDYLIDQSSRVVQLSSGRVMDLRRMMVFGGWTPLQDACFWRRDLYDRVGGIDLNSHVAMDYDLFLRFSYTGRCLYLPAVVSAFRRHTGQISIARRREYSNDCRRSRKRAWQALGIGRLEGALLRFLYFNALRVRVRLERVKSWLSNPDKGKDISTLKARTRSEYRTRTTA